MDKSKKLGLMNHIGMALGSAIGTGIFVMMGYGIAYTGRSIALVCAVGCLFMVLAYWYDNAFGSLFVLKGGDYSVRAMEFPPLLTGVSAWMTIATSLVLSSHAISITQFAEMLWPQIANFEKLFQVGVLALAFLCTVKGAKILARIQNFTVVILIVAIVLFLFYGIPQVNPAEFFSNADGEFMIAGIGGMLTAVSVMSWACSGTAANLGLSIVTEKPKRTIPLASWICTGLLAIIYFFMGYVASGAVSYDQIAGQNISVAAEAIMPHGPYLFFVIGGGIFAISSTLLAVLSALPYPIEKVAEDGWIPKAITKKTKGGYPWIINLIIFCVSLIPIITGIDIEGIVGNVTVPSMIMTIYLNFKCLRIPDKYPEQWENRGIRYPRWLWNLFSLAGGVFSIIVMYNWIVTMDTKATIMCVCELVILFGASAITLKKGWVSREQLEENRKNVIEEALAAEQE